jgi:hypothetical protein
MLFKCNDENTPFLTEVTKYRVCFWNIKSEHYENNRTSENVRQKYLQEKKFPELTAEKAKIQKITIRTWNSAELIKSKIVVDDS